jgi:hypothetical protein
LWLNFFVPVVRLAAPAANDVLFSLAQAIPVGILLAGLHALDSLRTEQKETWCTTTASADAWFAIIVGAVLVVPAAPVGLLGIGCAALTAGGGGLIELRDTVVSRAGTVRVYSTDGGALAPSGIIVQQECTIAPGIHLTRRLAHEYPADAADVKLDDHGGVRIALQIEEHEGRAIVARNVSLRHFCWGPTY